MGWSLARAGVIGLSVAGLVVVAGYAWWAQQPKSGPVQLAALATPAARPAAVVELAEVVAEAMPDELSAVGSLRSNESVILRPEVSGRISKISFKDGTPVARGAVLIEFDAAVQQAELQQAQANVSLAESNFRRTSDLFERRFISQSARDEAVSRREVARAAVQLAQAQLARMRVVAPFAGTVGIRNVSVGDYVKDGEDLVNLEDVSILKLDFRLPEIYHASLRVGQAVEVSSDALPGVMIPATIDAIDPLVDTQGRAVVMRASLPNADNKLRPGMFARVRVTLDARPSVPVVPEEALMPGAGNRMFVYRVVDRVANRVEVRTGARRDSRVEIVEGLGLGDVVVTAGQLKLRDGDEVRTSADGGGAIAPATASAHAG
ncbi:MAG: efflux RND transporter periplasmic adaptor subunit [Zoogloeaceae bacterium]|nr:efflux RND transporter periplasmic adaptor subunit [Zoogloeaceae bacterium]